MSVNAYKFSTLLIWIKPFWIFGVCGAYVETFGRLALRVGAWPLLTEKLKLMRLFIILTFPLIFIGFILIIIGTFLRMPIGVFLTSHAQNKA